MDSGCEDPEVSEFLHLRLCLEGLQGHLVKPLIHKEMPFLKVTRCSQRVCAHVHTHVSAPQRQITPLPQQPPVDGDGLLMNSIKV